MLTPKRDWRAAIAAGEVGMHDIYPLALFFSSSSLSLSSLELSATKFYEPQIRARLSESVETELGRAAMLTERADVAFARVLLTETAR